MTRINNNKIKIDSSLSIYSMLETIDKEAASSPMTVERYQALSQRLDWVSQQLASQYVTSSTLQDRVCSLSKQLIDWLVEHEIQDISHSADHPCSMSEIKRTLQRIKNLQRNHSLISDDRRRITQVKEKLVSQGQKKTTPTTSRKFQRLDNRRAKSSPFPFSSNTHRNDPVDPDAIYLVLEVAENVFRGNLKEAQKRFACLPSYQQKQFSDLVKQDGIKAFNNVYPSVRALLTMANTLARNGDDPPSNDQINEFFSKKNMPANELPVQLHNSSKLVSLY